MGLISALTTLAIIILLFLVFRAVMLWYWRISEIVENLQGINEKLQRLLDKG